MSTLEHPIIFSGEMVRAILEGRKTQTRRVIQPQPPKDFDWYGRLLDSTNRKLKRGSAMWTDDIEYHYVYCPYGQPGDRLWVRETFCIVDDTELGGEKWVDYKATPKYSAEHPAGWENDPTSSDALKWKPSIHMPRWASRITLEVVKVRVERVQEIKPLDAVAEGCSPDRHSIIEFTNLWNSINAKRGYGWDVNPWVWVIEFEVMEK